MFDNFLWTLLHQDSASIFAPFGCLVPESDTANDAGKCNEKQAEMVSGIPVGEVVFGAEGVEVEGVLEAGILERGFE